MSTKPKTIRLLDDFQELAKERMRAGKNLSVDEVTYDAFQKLKLAALREDIDEAIAQGDAGLEVECTPREFMARSAKRLGLTL